MARHEDPDRKRKVLLTLLVLGALCSLVGVGTFGAFSSTTSNSNNQFASGSVIIADNDAGSAMYSVSGKKPGDSVRLDIYRGTSHLTVHVKLGRLPSTPP